MTVVNDVLGRMTLDEIRAALKRLAELEAADERRRAAIRLKFRKRRARQRKEREAARRK